METTNMTSIEDNQPSRKQGRRRIQRTAATPDLLGRRLFLSVKEYCDLTGMPKPTVYKLVGEGKIKAVRIGGSLRIPVSEIRDLAA